MIRDVSGWSPDPATHRAWIAATAIHFSLSLGSRMDRDPDEGYPDLGNGLSLRWQAEASGSAERRALASAERARRERLDG